MGGAGGRPAWDPRCRASPDPWKPLHPGEQRAVNEEPLEPTGALELVEPVAAGQEGLLDRRSRGNHGPNVGELGLPLKNDLVAVHDGFACGLRARHGCLPGPGGNLLARLQIGLALPEGERCRLPECRG